MAMQIKLFVVVVVVVVVVVALYNTTPPIIRIKSFDIAGSASLKWLGVFYPFPLDKVKVIIGFPSPRPAPRIKSFGTPFNTWVKKGSVRVKCLAQEHNTITLTKAETCRPAQMGNQASKFSNIVTMVMKLSRYPQDR